MDCMCCTRIYMLPLQVFVGEPGSPSENDLYIAMEYCRFVLVRMHVCIYAWYVCALNIFVCVAAVAASCSSTLDAR